MASRSFIDGRTALLLTPLVSSTCSLLFAHDQDIFLRILTIPKSSELCNQILPSYIRTFFPIGLRRVVGFLAVTTWSSVGALLVAGPLLRARGSYGWYRAAAFWAVAHLLYVPLVAPRLKAIMDDEENAIEDYDEDDDDVVQPNIKQMLGWLTVNMTRMMTTDLAAWGCAFIATAKTFSLALEN